MLFKDEGFVAQMEQETGRTFEDLEDLRREVVFSKQDIIDYIKRHHLQGRIKGRTADMVPLEEVSSQDGLYLVKEGSEYRLFVQERGKQIDGRTFDSLESVQEYMHEAADDQMIRRYVEQHFSMYYQDVGTI